MKATLRADTSQWSDRSGIAGRRLGGLGELDGTGFLIVVVVGSLIGVGRLQLRERHNNPMKAWVRSQSPTFSTKALVRQRASGGNGLGSRDVQEFERDRS